MSITAFNKGMPKLQMYPNEHGLQFFMIDFWPLQEQHTTQTHITFAVIFQECILLFKKITTNFVPLSIHAVVLSLTYYFLMDTKMSWLLWSHEVEHDTAAGRLITKHKQIECQNQN